MSALSVAPIFILLGLIFHAGSATLNTDLEKFLDVIAFQDFAAPFLNTYQESKEFAACADFLVSQPFNDLLDELVTSYYYDEYMNLLTEHGVPGRQWVEKLRAMTHAPPFPVQHPPLAADAASLQRQDKNFMPFIYNMLPYIILTDIKDVYFYLSRTSVSFMALLDLEQSDQYQNTLAFLLESPEYQAVIDALNENGVDGEMIYNKLELEFRMTDF